MSATFDAAAIARITGGAVLAEGPAGPIATDTRALPAGCWFLALSGERFDGHGFVPQAVAGGAVGAVVSRPVDGPGGRVLVPDTVRALQDLGHAARRAFRGPVVGVTGSSGKTTTRAFVALALSPLGRVHQTVGNLNNHLGVPMTLLARPDDAAAMVVEMGTSSPGEIQRLAEIATPDVRLVVNVGPAHLQELGGLDGVAHEKGALFRTAAPGNTVCVNVDDPRVAAMPVPPHVRRLTFGSTGDVALLEAELDPDTLSTRCRWRTPEGEVRAVLPAPGRHLALNAAGAICAAVALGVDPAAAAAALERYEPVGMRMRAEPLPGGATALNDAYNANPQSMEASLRLVGSLPGERVVVLGDMLELGPTEIELHRSVARLAGALGFSRVVLYGRRMAEVADAAPGALATTDPAEAAAAVRPFLRPGVRILFKGSRGAAVERVLAALGGGAAGAGH
jgi:UDP-N-acetylmuramoyl-tripeptide--D-alanyl-D-alanine ligase